MPRYAPRDDGGAVYSEDEDAEQHLTMGPSGDCVTYAKLWHTPMLVGLSALSIPIWRCEEPRCLQPAGWSSLRHSASTRRAVGSTFPRFMPPAARTAFICSTSCAVMLP